MTDTAKNARRKREESGSSSSETDKPPSKTPKAFDLIYETDDPDAEGGLKEIWKVLTTIQDNTRQLLEDNRTLRKQYEDLKKSLEFHVEEVAEIKKQNAKLTLEVAKLQKNLSEANKRVDETNDDLDDAWQNLDILEQYTRKHNLEIHGILEKEGENVTDLIINLGNILNVKIRRNDIDICHRMVSTKPNLPRPIIARFLSYNVKKELYSARKHLRNIDIGQYFPGAEKIFINENLTKLRRGLFADIRKKKRQKEWHSTWTIDGKLFIKKELTGKPIRIFNKQDLDKL